MADKLKYQIEFELSSSPSLLFQYLSSPSGLSEWFADNVNSRGEYYSFVWDDSEEQARLASKKTDDKLKYMWVDEDKVDTGYYFEFKIEVDDITRDVSLIITDFAEEDELEESKQLWESQIDDLRHVIGST